MQYLACLESCARLYGLLGRAAEAAAARGKAERLRRGIIARVFDVPTGLFRDAEGSAHASFHANVPPLSFGLEPPGGFGRILSFRTPAGTVGAGYRRQGAETFYALRLPAGTHEVRTGPS